MGLSTMAVLAGSTTRTNMAACTAVVGVGVDVYFTAVERIAITVRKAYITRHKDTVSPYTSSNCVREGTDVVTCSTVVGVVGDIYLTTIGRIGIAVDKTKVADRDGANSLHTSNSRNVRPFSADVITGAPVIGICVQIGQPAHVPLVHI